MSDVKQYPMLWQRGLIQANVRARAGHRCEECGMEFVEGTNLAVSAKRKTGQPMVGTVHHIDHDKSNCSMNNLVYLCQSCHFKIHLWDWTPGKKLPKAWNDVPPEWVVKRGLKFRRQMTLFDLTP